MNCVLFRGNPKKGPWYLQVICSNFGDYWQKSHFYTLIYSFMLLLESLTGLFRKVCSGLIDSTIFKAALAQLCSLLEIKFVVFVCRCFFCLQIICLRLWLDFCLRPVAFQFISWLELFFDGGGGGSYGGGTAIF